jgi:hypothetical protein
MTFARIVFAFALLMLVVGIVGSRYISEVVFAPLQGSAGTPIAAATHAATPKAAATATATPTPTILPAPARAPTSTPRPTATISPTPTPRPLVTRVLKPGGKRLQHHRAKPKLKPTATATTLPTPTATTGTVALARYWVGSQLARGGQTVSIGYVIDNETGQTARVLLGASIKGSRVVAWSASLSDPYHDVVAMVPPGVSTHVRFFTLPPSLQPGMYDVAWGLRSARTGLRDALVTGYAALRVTH